MKGGRDLPANTPPDTGHHWRGRLTQAAYDAAIWLVQPLLRRKLRRRGQAEPGYLHAIPERFGHYADATTRPLPQDGAPVVWIHAVSLGETRAAAILLEALRAQWPGMRLLLTHGTATGRAAGQRLLQDGDVQVWQPWDTRGATRRFMARFQPDVGILMETEIWPNLVRVSNQAQVPLVLANARLSDPSMQGALRARWLMGPAYAGLQAALAQTEADAVRLRRVGAPVMGVLGNIKFDAEVDPNLVALGQSWRAHSQRPVIALASSREGEETQFLDAITALADGPQRPADAVRPQWLIVPRHPQRFDAVADLIRERGLSLSRRSQWAEAPTLADVWLGDSMGEMTAYYALSSVALLGGSFAPLGGQNMIEAAACGCPVVMGPHTFNFDEAAAQALRFDAARRVADMQEAVQAALDIAGNAALHEVMARASRIFARKFRGAAARTAQAIAAQVDERFSVD